MSSASPDLSGARIDGFRQYDSALSTTQQAAVIKLARRITLSHHPGNRPVSAVYLVGHADPGSGRGAAFEGSISDERARSVHAALARSLPPGLRGRIVWQRVPAGAEFPVTAKNNTERDRALNRRVEVFLYLRPRRGQPDATIPATIRWAQQCVSRLGSSHLAANGVLDGATYSAFSRLQAARGLPSTGLLGPATAAGLASACGLPNLALPPAPPLARATETTPPDRTLYPEISHGGEKPAKAMTGCYVPSSYRAGSDLNVILYLHGHHNVRGFPPDLTIDEYWRKARYPFWALREGLLGSGRNAVLVAPTLGPKSGSGWLTSVTGLERYLDAVLATLRTHHPAFIASPPTMGQIVLACHSGGGRVMLDIATAAGAYNNRIKECWGFDCLYNKGDEGRWVSWARTHPTSSLFVHYGDGGTRDRSIVLAGLAKKKHQTNVTIAGSAREPHNEVPIRHWRERLLAATFLT